MARALTTDPTQQFRFTVEVDGIVTGGFSKVSGLETELEVVEYREGGYTSTRKLPGIEKTGTATFERGAFSDIYLYQWFAQASKPDFRRDITVTERDRLGNPRRRWILSDAWVSKLAAPELDANSSEVAVESVEVQYESLSVENLARGSESSTNYGTGGTGGVMGR